MKTIDRTTAISRLALGLAIVCVLVLLLGHKTYATSDRKALSLNGQFTEGRIEAEGEADFFSVTIPSDGWLTITYQGWDIVDGYFALWSEDLTTCLYEHEVYYSSNDNPKTYTDVTAVESGNYFVKVYGCGSRTGGYYLRGSFEAAGNTEKDGNDAWASAMTLNCDQQVRGFFSWQDRSDFYKFSVTKNCTIQLILNSRVHEMYMSVWNSDFIQVVRELDLYYASEKDPKTGTLELNLDPGVYYVKCVPSGGNTGRYELKWKLAPTKVTAITIAGNRNIHVGESTQLTGSVVPSNANNKTLTWSSSNTNVAVVNPNTGKVTGKGIGSACITARATDDSEKSAEVIVCVGAKKMSSPKASAKGKKKVQLKWKQQNGVEKYQVQLSKKKSFKKAKTWAFDRYTTSAIKKVASKGTWYFRVRGVTTIEGAPFYGEWSKPKKVRVK